MYLLLAVAFGGYCDTTQVERDATLSAVTSSLKPLGYTAMEGAYTCDSGTGGAGNPESVSCMYEVGDTAISSTESIFPGKAPFFQLEMGDVLVGLGCAPKNPGPLYWGFSPYLAGFNVFDLLKMRPGAQLADSLNQFLLRSTTGSPPWGGSYAIVATAGVDAQRDATKALEKAGFPASAVNQVVFPAAYLQLGTRLSDNYLGLGSRAGPFHSPAEKAAYTKAVSGERVIIFRAKRSVFRRVQPLPTPTHTFYEPTNSTEIGLLPALEKTVAGVEAWAKSTGWRVKRKSIMHVQLRDGVWSNGTECATNKSTTGCFFDTTDAAYFDSDPFIALEANNTMDVVIGPNSALTGKAAYSSLAVYTSDDPLKGQNGVSGGAALSSMKYGGSALRFNADATELFAITVTDNECGAESWCLNAPDQKKGAVIIYVTRAYADPAPGRYHAPDPDQLLPPVVIRLERVA